jgi:hypothetical protein
MELDPIIISALQVNTVAHIASDLFRADLKNMNFHGDYTFSSCPTFPGCSLKVILMILDKLNFPSH